MNEVAEKIADGTPASEAVGDEDRLDEQSSMSTSTGVVFSSTLVDHLNEAGLSVDDVEEVELSLTGLLGYSIDPQASDFDTPADLQEFWAAELNYNTAVDFHAGLWRVKPRG